MLERCKFCSVGKRDDARALAHLSVHFEDFLVFEPAFTPFFSPTRFGEAVDFLVLGLAGPSDKLSIFLS